MDTEWYKSFSFWGLVVSVIILLIIVVVLAWLYSLYLKVQSKVQAIERGARNLLTEGRRLTQGTEQKVTEIVDTVKGKISNIDKDKLDRLTDSLNNLVGQVHTKVSEVDTGKLTDRASRLLGNIQKRVSTMDTDRLLQYVTSLIDRFTRV